MRLILVVFVEAKDLHVSLNDKANNEHVLPFYCHIETYRKSRQRNIRKQKAQHIICILFSHKTILVALIRIFRMRILGSIFLLYVRPPNSSAFNVYGTRKSN